MDAPLAGVRVLDLGQIYQGPYCGLVLSYLGAEVVKIEPPDGENVRFRSESGESPEVQFLNPNKQGVELNLKTERGREVLKDLVRESDVLVENFAPGKMAELGVGYDELSAVNPELIYAHGSGYGDTGPYTDRPAMDLTLQAIGGVMHTTGYPDNPPVKTGPGIADFLGGIHLATGIVSALYKREGTGEGEYVDVGMMDTLYPTLTSPIAASLTRDDVPPRTGNRHSGMAIAPYNVYEVTDGYVAIICITEPQWEALAELMDRPDLLAEERFATKASRAQNMDEVDGSIQDWIEQFNKEEAVEKLLEWDIPCAPVKTTEELIADPQLHARGMIQELPDKAEEGRTIPVPGMPIKFEGSDPPDTTPSPRLGEHSERVLTEVCGYSEDEVRALREQDVI